MALSDTTQKAKRPTLPATTGWSLKTFALTAAVLFGLAALRYLLIALAFAAISYGLYLCCQPRDDGLPGNCKVCTMCLERHGSVQPRR